MNLLTVASNTKASVEFLLQGNSQSPYLKLSYFKNSEGIKSFVKISHNSQILGQVTLNPGVCPTEWAQSCVFCVSSQPE